MGSADTASTTTAASRSNAIRQRLERQYIVYKPSSATDLDRQLRDAEDNTDVVIDLSAFDCFDDRSAAIVAEYQPLLEARSSTLVLANVPAETRQVLAAADLATLIRRRR